MRPTRLRIAAAAAVAAAAIAVLPSSASAGLLVSDAVNCDTQVFSQTFLPFADPAEYTLLPGGSFERGAPHWLLNSAAIADGNEPAYVTAPSDTKSLSIAAGGSASSSSICVGIEHPDLRFFAKPSNPLAKLTVEVLYEDAAGNDQSLPIATITGVNGWALTPQIPIVANLLPLLPGNHTPVAFRFSASGGSFQIDDVWVDPMQRW